MSVSFILIYYFFSYFSHCVVIRKLFGGGFNGVGDELFLSKCSLRQFASRLPHLLKDEGVTEMDSEILLTNGQDRVLVL